jgi:electron transfer flavoprotein alpha subunit
MAGIYIIARTPEAAAELVGAAQPWQHPMTIVTFAQDPQPFTTCGAQRVVHLAASADVPENYVHALAEYLAQEQADVLLAAADAIDQAIAAGVAGYLDCAMATDAATLDFDGQMLTVTHSVYGGKVVETLSMPAPCVASVSAGIVDPASGTADVEEIPVDVKGAIVRTNVAPKQAASVDVSKAERVVCVGLGVKNEEDMALARQLADALGAELVCTRSVAEERKWMPVERYVGITGAILNAKLYVGIGVSGQVQHTYGIRNVDTVMAVNTDAKAPIMRECDYGVVASLYDVVPALIEAIER